MPTVYFPSRLEFEVIDVRFLTQVTELDSDFQIFGLAIERNFNGDGVTTFARRCSEDLGS